MKPLTPVAPGTRVVLGLAFFMLFVAVWSAATFSGWVNPIFLADPLKMLRSGWTLLTEMGFAHDIGMTVWRVLGGFAIAAALAVPLGVLMGAYKPIEAFFEPFVSFARYLPASAFIPLLILWFGIYESQKVAFLFLGVFVYLLPVVVSAIRAVPEELVQTALTLGVSRWQAVRTVLVPAALPEIFDSFRVMNAISWTYVILAEAVNPEHGLGYMVELARTHQKASWSFAGLLVIGGIGLLTDALIRACSAVLFRWREKAA